jgi:hypothetical protein
MAQSQPRALVIGIVSGTLKGGRIATPASEATRPTSDRARQAVFNISEHAAWSDGVGGLAPGLLVVMVGVRRWLARTPHL